MPSFRKTEFVEEEISQHAHVEVKTSQKPQICDVLATTNWVTLTYFLLASLAAVFIGCLLEGEVSFLWILLGLALISIVLFWRLKL